MLHIFAVKDVKVGFLNPFYQNNTEEAKRTFATALRDKKCAWNAYPADLELWALGDYDEQTGIIAPFGPDYIMGGKDVSLE